MLTLGLLGASVALFSSPDNRRVLFGPAPGSTRRSDDGTIVADTLYARWGHFPQKYL